MNGKYSASKITLASASFLAFTGIAAWISMNGPFGATSGSAQVATQSQTSTTQRVRVSDDDGERSYSITIPNSSGSVPVARSRGS